MGPTPHLKIVVCVHPYKCHPHTQLSTQTINRECLTAIIVCVKCVYRRRGKEANNVTAWSDMFVPWQVGSCSLTTVAAVVEGYSNKSGPSQTMVGSNSVWDWGVLLHVALSVFCDPPPPPPPPPHTHTHTHPHPGTPGQAATGTYSMVGTPAMAGSGSVLMLYGLAHGRINCDHIFNLLCSYGNVLKVLVR